MKNRFYFVWFENDYNAVNKTISFGYLILRSLQNINHTWWGIYVKMHVCKGIVKR
jgi:hypothetical protein